MSRMSGFLTSRTVNPGSILDGDEIALTDTVPGAKLGDFALSSFSIAIGTLTMTSYVSAVNTVTTVLANNTGGAIDLASGILRVKVIPADVI